MPATATVISWRSGAIDHAVLVAGMARSYKKTNTPWPRRLSAAQRNPSIPNRHRCPNDRRRDRACPRPRMMGYGLAASAHPTAGCSWEARPRAERGAGGFRGEGAAPTMGFTDPAAGCIQATFAILGQGA